ncbi:MAG TPA: hypothetical protein VJK05_00805 [archaeon]|nr:hypothetical protein [archaeon]
MARRPSKPSSASKGTKSQKSKGGQATSKQPITPNKGVPKLPDISNLAQEQKTELLRQLAAQKGRSEKQIADVAAKLEELYQAPTEGIELRLADQTALKSINQSLTNSSLTTAQIKKLYAIYNRYFNIRG